MGHSDQKYIGHYDPSAVSQFVPIVSKNRYTPLKLKIGTTQQNRLEISAKLESVNQISDHNAF